MLLILVKTSFLKEIEQQFPKFPKTPFTKKSEYSLLLRTDHICHILTSEDNDPCHSSLPQTDVHNFCWKYLKQTENIWKYSLIFFSEMLWQAYPVFRLFEEGSWSMTALETRFKIEFKLLWRQVPMLSFDFSFPSVSVYCVCVYLTLLLWSRSILIFWQSDKD